MVLREVAPELIEGWLGWAYAYDLWPGLTWYLMVWLFPTMGLSLLSLAFRERF